MTRIVLAFAIFGVLWGAWVVTLADLANELALGPAHLGACSSLGIVGSLVAMSIAGGLVAQRGSTIVGVVGALAIALGLLATATLARSFRALLASVVLMYTAGALYDVAINASAAALERSTRKKLMPFAHASFSGGGALGAFGAGAALSAGVPFRTLYLALAGLLVFEACALALLRLPTSRPAAVVGPGTRSGTLAVLFGGAGLGLLGAVAAAVFFTEGAMENWSTYYLRSSLAAPALLGSSGAGFFHLAMFTGRMGSGVLVRRVGNVTTLLWTGALVVVGTVVATVTRDLAIVVAGFAIVGVALSGGFPVALSLAGEAVPERTAQAVAAVTLVGYSGFLLGPGMFGAIAETTSLRAAFATFLVTGAFVVLAARALRVRGR